MVLSFPKPQVRIKLFKMLLEITLLFRMVTKRRGRHRRLREEKKTKEWGLFVPCHLIGNVGLFFPFRNKESQNLTARWPLPN